MAFLSIPNVVIRGIAACVPAHIEENINLPVFKEGEAERVIKQTNIARKHTVENGTTASDLCAKAFEGLIKELGWELNSIEVLVFVTAGPDYIVPPTACILQHRLGLSENTLTIEIRQGCPGWVIGLASIAGLLSNSGLKRGVLLCGDTPTLTNSPLDKETRPLFGDAGTVTALEFAETASPLEFHHGTKGQDFKAIWIPYGGTRNPVTEDALKFVEYRSYQFRRLIDTKMDGMQVFSFGLSIAPKSVLALGNEYKIDFKGIDYFLFHQANHYMNEKIRKKLKIEPEKVPYCMQDYGNTGSSSIALTIVTQCRKNFINKKLDNVACAFGVGLAWGSVHFKTDKIVCPELILY